MHLLSVRQNEALPRSHAPDHGDIVLFSAACRAGFSRCEGVGIGEAEAPADAAFGVGDAFAAGDGGEVDGVEGAVGGGAGGGGGGHFVCVCLSLLLSGAVGSREWRSSSGRGASTI